MKIYVKPAKILTFCFVSPIRSPPAYVSHSYLPTCLHKDWEWEQIPFQLPARWRRQRPLKIDPRVHVMIVGLAWNFSNWKVDSSSLGYGCWGIKQKEHWEWHLHWWSLVKCNNLIFSMPLGKDEDNFLYFKTLISTIDWSRTWKFPPVPTSKFGHLRHSEDNLWLLPSPIPTLQPSWVTLC